jgi:predicted phage tail component-like protein
MLNNGFTFNAVRKHYLLTIKKKRQYWAPIRRNFIIIPGRPGALLDSTKTDVRVIAVDVEVSAECAYDLQKLSEEFAEWLITTEPKELVFDDEEDRIYNAVVDGAFLDPEEIISNGYGTITFICPDPYKYGPEKSLTNPSTFNVEGTVETQPVIKVKIKQDTTYVAVSNGERLNLIGNPIQAEQVPFEPETRRFWHECNSLVGWGATSSIEGGINRGTLKANSYAFYTDDYGADSGWHGPAMKRSLGATLQDFKVDVLLSQKGASGQVGSVEIALLDASNQIVAKMLVSKRSAGSQANYARLRAGSDAAGHDIINERGDTEWVWADFEGILRISRKGNEWTAYVAKYGINEAHHSSRYRLWTDSEQLYTAPVSQVQVQLWQYSTVPATAQMVHDIKVYQINEATETQIPYIARIGDIIEFDHQADIIRKNGEDITREKAFIGEYFPLNKGKNTLIVEPSEAIESVETRWKPKWL